MVSPRPQGRAVVFRGAWSIPSWSVLVPVELGCFVVLTLAGATLDLFLFGQEPLELRVRLLDKRGGLFGRLVGGTVDLGGLARRTAAAATGTDDPALRALARRLADGHRRFLLDLVLGRRLVGQDLALVDPHLHTDATEGRLRLGVAVVDVGAQCVQRDTTLAVPLLARH